MILRGHNGIRRSALEKHIRRRSATISMPRKDPTSYVPRQEPPSSQSARILVGNAVLWWLALCAAAFATGTARVALLEPKLGELLAHQVGTVALCAIIASAAYYVVAKSKLSPLDALLLGAIWLLLTLAFEFGFFRYAMGVPLATLLADYNLAEGRLWPLVLVTDLLSPWLCARWRKATA